MKLSLALVAIAGSVATVNAAECTYERHHGSASNRKYYIGAGGVGDISGICNGFWDNLKGQTFCQVGSFTCGQGGNGGGHLHAELIASNNCTPQKVHDAWWAATRNNWGGINCTPR